MRKRALFVLIFGYKFKMKVMKSRLDFKTQEEYKEYLKFHFAGLAMQGLLASRNWQVEPYTDGTPIVAADFAVEFADRLLKKLEQ